MCNCNYNPCRCNDGGLFAPSNARQTVIVNEIPVPGEPGETPYIGPNGNWWTGSIDSGIPATPMYELTQW